jgi:hypothetical protein
VRWVRTSEQGIYWDQKVRIWEYDVSFSDSDLEMEASEGEGGWVYGMDVKINVEISEVSRRDNRNQIRIMISVVSLS